jgi:hypothetical protein
MTFHCERFMSKPHGKARSLADFGLHNQSGAMPGEDVLDDGKPETRALFRSAGLDINPVESFGEPWNVLGRNARPVIATVTSTGVPDHLRERDVNLFLPGHICRRFRSGSRRPGQVRRDLPARSTLPSGRCSDLDTDILGKRQPAHRGHGQAAASRSIASSGAIWDFSSSRDRDRRSSTSRLMRVACSNMMPRNAPCAFWSLRPAPAGSR